MTLAQLRRQNAERLRARLKLERAVLKLLELGPRVLVELMAELTEEHGPDIADRIEHYSTLPPDLVRAVGADRMVDRSPRLVTSR